MALFGESNATKDARSNSQQIPNYMLQMMKDMFGGAINDDQLRAYFQQMFGGELVNDLNTNGSGIDTPLGQQNLGFQLLPGVTEYSQQVPGAARTNDDVLDILNEYGGFLNQKHDATQSDIAGQYRGMIDDSDKTTADLLSQITGGFGEGKSLVDNSYTDSMSTLEALKPGSQARAGRVARSFSPAMAAAEARLRRGGVSSGSPEAITMLNRVDQARARQMDDSLAGDTDAYVGKKIGLDMNRIGSLLGLVKDRVAGTTGATDAGMRLRNALREGGLKANIAEGDKRASGLSAYYQARAGLPGQLRSDAITDFDNKIKGYQTAFGVGQNATTTQANARNTLLNNLRGLYGDYGSSSTSKLGLAGGFGQTAQQGYQDIIASDKGGWLGNLLTGLAGSAVGAAVSGMTGGAAGGGGGLFGSIRNIFNPKKKTPIGGPVNV